MKPRYGTAENWRFCERRLRDYLDAGGEARRSAFRKWCREQPEETRVSSKDLDTYPGRWRGLVQTVTVQAGPLPVDVSALDFDDDETMPGAPPTVAERLGGAPVPTREIAIREPADEAPARTRAKKTWLITYAQNATPVDDNFLASLLSFCDHRNAELVALPGRYRNPTSVWSRDQEDREWWDSRLAPYLYRGRLQLAPGLMALGDVSIQPTAVRPLTGFEVFTGANSAIFAHPKIQLMTVATATRDSTRVLATTGACTIPNYTDSKAGKKGEAHHVLGAALVEVDEDGAWHLRQINGGDDGEFTDLAEHFTPYGVEPAARPLALVLGDVHVAQVDETVAAATLTDDASIARTLLPEAVLYHDVLDFRARNHHDRGNPDAAFARAFGDAPDVVSDEVAEAVRFVDEATPAECEPVVIASNHDEAFDRWLREADPRTDPVNARYFHEMRAASLAHYQERGEWASAFELAYRKHSDSWRARLLRRGEPYTVAGIECSFHGDKGTNGARASTLSYAKLGVKTVIGHSHTPAILDGCYQCGVTGKLDQGYNLPPSSWAHAHCVIYATGKRSLIFVRPDGRWRATTSAQGVEVAA